MKRHRKLHRRAFLAGSATAIATATAAIPAHRWDGFDFGCLPTAADRLDQGPFDIDQDEGWRTLVTTTPSNAHIRNYGLGLVGYTWEENGPSIPARN